MARCVLTVSKAKYWDKLRVGLDLTNSMDMVAFFRKLLGERAMLEKEEVMGKALHDSCSDDSGGCS